MKKILITFIGILFLLGCQGTPRYGGGRYADEGAHANQNKPNHTQIQSSESSVDPIAMGRIIDRYLGKPYAGTAKGQKGYDCSEFVGSVYQEYASFHLPRTTKKLWKTGKRVDRSALYFGDLVFFDTGGRGVSHVGIYIGFDEFVHASLSKGIIISSLSDKYYRKRYVGARRVME